MVEGQLILAGVVIAIVFGVILEKALKVLLVEGHALARDNIVVDVVGLLRNSDRTGGSNTLVVDADNVQGHLTVLVELRSSDGDVLVFLDERIATLGSTIKVARIIGDLGSGVVEILIVAVGERDRLASRSAGHSVLDGLIADNGDVDRDIVSVIAGVGRFDGHRSSTEEAVSRVEVKLVAGANGIRNRNLAGQTRVAINNAVAAGRQGQNANALDGNVSLIDLIDGILSQLFKITEIEVQRAAIDYFVELAIECRNINGVINAISLSLIGDGCGDFHTAVVGA